MKTKKGLKMKTNTSLKCTYSMNLALNNGSRRKLSVLCAEHHSKTAFEK